MTTKRNIAHFAFRFVLIIGIVNLFADFTYEGGRSGIVVKENRGTAFDVFDTGFGISWFLGSVAMGFLYDKSIPALISFSIVLHLTALPVFLIARNRPR